MCAAVETYGDERELKGKKEEKIETAKNLRKMEMDVSFIAKALNVTPDEVSKWLGDNQTQ